LDLVFENKPFRQHSIETWRRLRIVMDRDQFPPIYSASLIDFIDCEQRSHQLRRLDGRDVACPGEQHANVDRTGIGQKLRLRYPIAADQVGRRTVWSVTDHPGTI